MSSSSYPVWEGKVVLTMQKVVNPAQFVVKEAPSTRMSNSLKEFIKLEEIINKNLKHIHSNTHLSDLPFLGSLVIVRCSHDKQWYRARVEGIVDSTRGVCISAYLVDYGYAILVERHWVQYTSETVFDIPFQAVNCFLIGLKPKSMTLLDGITVTHGPSKKWDTAAFEFVQKLVNQSGNMWTEVTYQDEEGNIYGQLFFSIGGETVCLNEELLKQNYAWYSEEEVQKVMSKSKGEAILPKSVSIESSSSTSHLHLLSKANQKNIEKKNYEALKVSERGKLEEEEAGQNSQMSGQFRNEQQLQSYDSVINQNNKPPNYRACVGRGIFRSPPKQVTSLFRVSPDGKKGLFKSNENKNASLMPGERTTNLKVAGRGYRNLTGITKMLLKADNHGMLADEVIVQRANLRGGLKTRLQSAKNADESSLENNAIRTGCQKASFTGSDALTLNSLNDSKGLSEDSSIIQSDEHYEVKNSIRSSRDNVNCDYSSQSFTSVKAVSEKLVNVKSLLLNARKRETRHSLSGSDISDQDFDSLSKSGTNKTDLSETISSNRLLLPGVSDCKHKKEKEVLSSSLQSAVSCPTYTEKTTLHVSAHTTEEQCRSSPAAKLTLNLLCKLRTGKLGNHTPAQIVQSDVSETQSSLKSVAVKIEPQKLKDSQPHSIKLQSLACHEKDVTSICNSVQLSKPMNSLSPRVSPRSEISVSQVQTPEISEHAVGSDISYANQNLKSCGKSDLRNLLSLIKKKNSTNCSTKSVTTVNNQCSHHVLHSKDTTTIGTKFRDNYLGYKDIGHFTKDCGNNLRKEEVAVSSDMLKSIGKKHVQESENSKTGKEQVMLDDTLENIKIQGSQNNNLSKGVSNCRFENKMMKSLQNNKFIQREITLDGALGSKTEHPEIQNNNFGKEVRVLHDKCENKMTKLVDENYGNNLREKVVAASDITLENEKKCFHGSQYSKPEKEKCVVPAVVLKNNIKSLDGDQTSQIRKEIEEPGYELQTNTTENFQDNKDLQHFEKCSNYFEKEVIELPEVLENISKSENVVPLYSSPSEKYFQTKDSIEYAQIEKNEEFDILPPEMAPCYTNFEKDDYLCKKLNSPSITMKRKQPCVRAICHGHHVPRPILSVDNAPFDDFVIKKLKAIKFCGPSCIQSVVWPAVLRGRSVIAVGPPHSGKTLSYLLPLLSSVLQLNTYLEIPDGSGLQLINGCDFLIATPSSFLRMLHNHEGKVTNLRRCCHLVLDDGETLVEDFTKQVRDVLMEYASSVRQRGDIAAPNQIILCTEKWTEGTKSFMYNCMKDPLVFFSSLFEAAIYALIPNFVEICDSSQRTATLLNLVSNNNGLKIVVCMSSPALALEVHRILKNFSIYSILAHDNMLHYDLNEVAQEWHTSHAYGSHPVLVVSDNILSALQVRNAQCLIHYDLPEISRFQFGSRYLTLSDYFPRIAELSKEDLKTLEVECFSHLILTEDSLKQTTTLVQFIERTGRKAPLKLKEMAKKYQNEYFKQTNVPLCLNLKAYGRCSSEDKCFKRHHIAIQDKPVNLPTSGEVKVLITHVVNASHLFVQLLGHRTLSTSDDASFLQFTPWNNEVQRLKTELNDYYKVFENFKPNLQPVEGDICALKDKDENILRVMIKSGPQLTQAGDSVKVKVYSIDEGKELYVELDHLLLLPEEWKQVSPQVVEVFMCRVQPVDGDLQWTPQASIFIHHLIHRKELVGRIALCIGHTLWLDPLVVRERLENVNIWVNAVRPRSELIKAGYAISNPNHLKSLYKACQGQIPVSTEILRTDSKPLYKQQNYPKPELPHGFLELGAYQDIYVSVVQTPHLFFVQKANIISCLEDLVNDINMLVSEGKLEKETRLCKGTLCIAPFDQDGRWYRAKVQQVQPSDNVNNDDHDVHLFFVDFGDKGTAKRKEIFRITEKQLLLPAQAIECSLVNLVPPHGGWSEQAGDAFWEKTLEDNVNKRLVIKPISDSPACYIGNRCYNVCLYDTITEKDIDIAEELAKEGWGRLADVQNCDVNQNEKLDSNLTADVSSETNSVKESSGTEEDLLHEESEATGKFLSFIAKKFIHDVLQHSKVTESMDEDDEIVKHNDNPSISESLTPLTSFVSKDSPSLSVPSDIPPLVAVEGITKSFTPHICWWQNKSHVTVKVQLTAVKEYDLTVSHTHLHFCTQWEGRLYRFEEELFASINPNGSKDNTSDRCVIIELEKSSFGERWTRLVKTIKKRPHIHIDFDHLDTSSSDEESVVKGPMKEPDDGGEKGEILPVDPSDLEDQNDAYSGNDSSDENVFENKDPFDILS